MGKFPATAKRTFSASAASDLAAAHPCWPWRHHFGGTQLVPGCSAIEAGPSRPHVPALLRFVLLFWNHGFCGSNTQRMWLVALCRLQEESIWVSKCGCKKRTLMPFLHLRCLSFPQLMKKAWASITNDELHCHRLLSIRPYPAVQGGGRGGTDSKKNLIQATPWRQGGHWAEDGQQCMSACPSPTPPLRLPCPCPSAGLCFLPSPPPTANVPAPAPTAAWCVAPQPHPPLSALPQPEPAVPAPGTPLSAPCPD